MTNYINPFEKRTFSERFKAVFAFMKQNFVQVMKFYLLAFVAVAALVCWYETVNPDSSLNNLGSLICFVAFAYFAHYIANRGDVRTVSFKEMWKSMGSALGKMVVASLLPMGLAVLFVLVFAVYFLVMVLVVGGGFDNVNGAFIFVLLPLLVFVLYVIPIFSIYYIHFYFSSSFKGSYDALEESFRMVKGHWWSTMGFIVLFEILQLAVLLPAILILQEKATFFSGWIGNLLIFIVSFFTTHVVTLYQYGHLKALREEQGEEKTKIITAKGIVVAVVIFLLSLFGALNTERISSALLNLAAKSGNPSAQNEIGHKCIKEQNYKEAFDWFMKAAEGGNALAQCNLGICYREGLGVTPDSLESFSWINKAAAQGSSEALNDLGVCYMRGYGVEMDKNKARELYMLAAERGNLVSMNNLAKIYTSGNGVEKDEKEAVKWWSKSADKGNATAQYELGLCYLEGKGVPQDSLECFSWINKAAEQEHVDALNQLAYCYAEGIGTDVNISMAHATIDKAIQIDPDDANLYDSKGEFYVLVGDRENAQDMYEKVLEKDSTFYKGVQESKLYTYINDK